MDVKDELYTLVAVAETPERALQGLKNLALVPEDDAEDASREGENAVDEDTSKSTEEPVTTAGVTSNGAEAGEQARKLKAGSEGNGKVNHSPYFEHVLTPTHFELGNDVLHASRNRSRQDVGLCNSISPSKIILGQLDYAVTCFGFVTELFDEMPARDLTSWKNVISAVVTVSAYGVAFEVLSVSDDFSWNAMVYAYMGFGLVSAVLDRIIVLLIIWLVFDPRGDISSRCSLFRVHFYLEDNVDFNSGGVDMILSTTKNTEDLLGE